MNDDLKTFELFMHINFYSYVVIYKGDWNFST